MRLPTLLALPAVLLLPAIASAQGLEDYDYENLEFRGIGVEVGWVWPRRIEPTLAVGLRTDLGDLGPNVRVVPGITFWSSSLNEGEVAELRRNILALCRDEGTECVRELGEIQISDLVLSANAHYTFPLDVATPYAGAGLALHLLNGRGDVINDTFVEDQLDTLTPGVELIGGVELPLGRSLRLFAEGRGSLASDVQYVGIHAGGSWIFPVPSRPAAQRGGSR